ncbi:MAG: PilZ domain-containing protein [Candidatus Acidiferrum sp.]
MASRHYELIARDVYQETATPVVPAMENSGIIMVSMSDQKLNSAKRWPKNRRSQRIELNVPVVVYRATGEGRQFYESTHTLVVSAHGALIALTDMVVPRQKLQVQNQNSGQHLECRVVSMKKGLIGPPQVAVEFTQPAASFWHIAFPPADWNPGV